MIRPFVGADRLTPDEAQTISAIVAKRAELLGQTRGRDGRTERAARRSCRASTPSDADPPPLRDHLTRFPTTPQRNVLSAGYLSWPRQGCDRFDDVVGQATKAGAKGAGVVIDDEMMLRSLPDTLSALLGHTNPYGEPFGAPGLHLSEAVTPALN